MTALYLRLVLVVAWCALRASEALTWAAMVTSDTARRLSGFVRRRIEERGRA